jgi:hypothetical protein
LNRRVRAAVGRRLAALLLASTAALASAGARGDDYVSIRGVYYREASTRVIQPMVSVGRDSPTGVDVDAHFLVDAITSASIAAGTSIDNLFTEVRDEVGLRVRKRWERSDVSLAYKYSAESDYWSHSIGASVGQRVWGDTGSLRLSLGRSYDTMAANGQSSLDCHGFGGGMPTCFMNGWFAGGSYSQILSPVALAQLSYEIAYLDGYQGNVYRKVAAHNDQPEFLPPHRMRNAIAPRVAYYLPSTSTGFQLHYRFYFDYFPGNHITDSDPWLLMGHTIEARVYQDLSPTLQVRLLFRYYHQNHARFWCAPPVPSRLPATEFCAVSTDPPAGYSPNAAYFTADPKLGPMHTEYPEVQLLWQADALREVPFLRWFSAGSFEISYGYYFQSTAFGNAHVVQTGYRLPY